MRRRPRRSRILRRGRHHENGIVGASAALHVRRYVSDIANREKKMPDDFIREDGYGITDAARRYLQPLIRGESPPPYGRDGLPKYVALKNALVAKRLPEWQE